MKICKICEKEKELEEFHKNKNAKDGRYHICKECRNKTIFYTPLSKGRKKIDRNFLLSMKRSLKKNKYNKWEKFVDFSYTELREKLESTFEEDFTWDNFEKVWCMDFIIPRCFYSYKNFLGIEFKKCWNIKNIRSLRIHEALKKTKTMNFELVNEYKLYDILPIGINYKKEMKLS